MTNEITQGIYDSTRKSRTPKQIASPHPQHKNCTSANFKAIAEANLVHYEHLRNHDDVSAEQYWDEWIRYHNLAISLEEDELRQSKTKRWKHLLEKDPRKLWKQLDWKGHPQTRPDEIPPETISKFFRNIFQSPILADKPTIANITDEIVNYDTTLDITDNDVDMKEVEYAIKKLGTGSSFDGIAPGIISLLPNEMRECILLLYRKVFDCYYPDQWKTQLLIPFPKKGHTQLDPKLRGIAIGPILSRVYDIIVDRRFMEWYHPNPEQAGSREEQGCVLQIFAFIILLCLAKELGKYLYVGLIDYEKAFDFVNRAELMRSLMKNNIGQRFLRNFTNIYRDTKYITKVSDSRMGNEISTDHGVTQGKNSSGNVFSFFISDMKSHMENVGTNDFMDPMNLLQLADDTSTIADNIISFIKKMLCLLQYSIQKHQKVNNGKTKYLHMCNSATFDDIHLDDHTAISSVLAKEGYSWLGFWLTSTEDLVKLIQFNLNKKMYVTCKFYSWLKMNEETPFKLKIKVLYGCMFESLIYSCEAWCDISEIAEKLLGVERKALKSVLGVKKKGTPDDLIYHELSRADIVASIKERQFNFYKKILNFTENDAVVRMILNRYELLSKNHTLTLYYANLQDNSIDADKVQRKSRISNSTTSMCMRYAELTDLDTPRALYSTLCDDRDRILITRWRLSSHGLFVETGRRKLPKIPRNERVCIICRVLEDENHSLFHCTAHMFIRIRYQHLLEKYPSVKLLLDPDDMHGIKEVAEYIREIEKNMKNLKMGQ